MNREKLEQLINEVLKKTPSKEEVDNAIRPAMQKYKRIIEISGDANGERRTEAYFAQLVVEEIREQRFSELTIGLYDAMNKKKSVAEANAHQEQQHYNIFDSLGQDVKITILIEGARI